MVPQNLSITFIYRALPSWKSGCEKKVLPLFEMNADPTYVRYEITKSYCCCVVIILAFQSFFNRNQLYLFQMLWNFKSQLVSDHSSPFKHCSQVCLEARVACYKKN